MNMIMRGSEDPGCWNLKGLALPDQGERDVDKFNSKVRSSSFRTSVSKSFSKRFYWPKSCVSKKGHRRPAEPWSWNRNRTGNKFLRRSKILWVRRYVWDQGIDGTYDKILIFALIKQSNNFKFWTFRFGKSSFGCFKGLYKPSCKNIKILNPTLNFWVNAISRFGNSEPGIAYVVIIGCSIWEKNDSYMIFLKIQLILEIQKIRNPSPDPHVNTNMAPKPQDYIKKISNSNNFHANYFICPFPKYRSLPPY